MIIYWQNGIALFAVSITFLLRSGEVLNLSTKSRQKPALGIVVEIEDCSGKPDPKGNAQAFLIVSTQGIRIKDLKME